MTSFKQERIQKVLAQLGVASRRTIESWIQEGKISVNGTKATLGQPIGPHDRVQVSGKTIPLRNYGELPTRVLMYYKPEGEVCSHQAMEECPSVFAALPHMKDGKWVMIGRLDVNSMGLLLFTNNGQLAHSMMHPRFQVPRKYVVRTLGKVTDEHIENMKMGVLFEEGLFKFDEFIVHPDRTGVNQWFTVTLHQGHYREVRRLFESQGVTVNRLSRIQFGDVMLPRELRRGKWQELSEMAVKRLMKRYVNVPVGEERLVDEQAPGKTVYAGRNSRSAFKDKSVDPSSFTGKTLHNPLAGKKKTGQGSKKTRIPVSFR
jgi:23S rRNA pseudouridine2605 synthase